MKKFLSLLMTLAVIGGIVCMPISAQANTTNNVTAASVARASNCPNCGPVGNLTEKDGGEYNVLIKTEDYGSFSIGYYEIRQDYRYICPRCRVHLGFAFTSVVNTYIQRV